MLTIQSDQASGRRAVQYLRMSADHQRYSIERQAVAISEYARVHGFQILRSYTDPGKSGLSLKGRKALQQLLADTMSPTRDFDTILVLDVSRWGRFQDPDEAAHYEFVCKQAGVRVEYCSEPFENDGSIASSIAKVIKRLMASEYSRDLSAKMFAAHLRHARHGHIQGQPTPYGIRRQLVSFDGKPLHVMEPGERKAIQGTWIEWVPGPENELQAVRTIFDLYARRQIPMGRIIQQLNENPDFRGDGWVWTAPRVRGVLQNEVYIGNYTYNRTTNRLQTQTKKNDESLWIRSAILPPVVSEALFIKTQQRLHTRKGSTKRYTDKELLVRLRKIQRKHGRITETLIRKSGDLSSAGVYWTRFGSLENAYKQIGQVLRGRCRDKNGALWTDESRLSCLRELYLANGYISRRLINETPDMPAASVYFRHYGSMKEACRLAGIPAMEETEISRASAAQRTERYEAKPVFRETCFDGRVVWSSFSNEEIIGTLRRLLDQHGCLSVQMVRESPDLPSIGTMYARFGSLLKAYELAGWTQPRSKILAINNARRRAKWAAASQEQTGDRPHPQHRRPGSRTGLGQST